MATISVEDLKKMKVNDLKKELKDRGLQISGTKDVLLERLQAAVQGAVPAGDGTVNSATDDSVEKSIDQLVGEPTAAAPSAPATTAVVTSKENIPAPKPAVEVETAEKKVVSLTGLSEAERLKARAAKFGSDAVPDSAKKLMRAQRFGLTESTSVSTVKTGLTTTKQPEDLDKMKKRAERFGMVVSNKLSKVDEDERKRKRLERFGAATASSTGPKKVRLNSSDGDMEEKKRKRAERFGLT